MWNKSYIYSKCCDNITCELETCEIKAIYTRSAVVTCMCELETCGTKAIYTTMSSCHIYSFFTAAHLVNGHAYNPD